MWDRRRRVDGKDGERFRISELQEFIELPLVTNSAAQPRSNISTAWRTRAVIGINHDVIRKIQIEIMQGMELLFGQLLRVFLT